MSAIPRSRSCGLPKQRRLARAVTRKPPGSKNRRKSGARLRRHHHQVACARRHFLHQISNRLVKTHDRLVTEDLNIGGLLHNRRLARAISDAAWGELNRQLAYKQAWRGGHLMLADRWLPSSKTCSVCGSICRSLDLGARTFRCPEPDCGASLDRDLNAAINLAAWAENQAQAGTAKQAARTTMPSDRPALARAHADETSLDELGTCGQSHTTSPAGRPRRPVSNHLVGTL